MPENIFRKVIHKTPRLFGNLISPRKRIGIMAQTPKVGRKLVNARMKATKARDEAVGLMFGGKTVSDQRRGLNKAGQARKKVVKARTAASAAIKKNPESGLKKQVDKKMAKNEAVREQKVIKAKRSYGGTGKLEIKRLPKKGKR
jgi:hypothetical protein